ncbi:Karyopherin transporter [Collariella sp. IMI 366227]|nr:Karyopherin transporter [Collariella sp. IMI 366227]
MPVSIEELDATVRAFYEGRGEQQKAAQAALNQFKEDPDAWLMVDDILSRGDIRADQMFVLLGCGSGGIRNFVVQYILQCSSSEEALKTHRTLLNKLNLVLVSVLKQEWPHNWPTFINEIISACHSSLSVCENNMIILRLLSEEVFDYSADQMTSAKTRNLKTTMCAEFSLIFQLCQEILNSATQPSLIKATLDTLLRFCNWIPLGYIFETPLIGDAPDAISRGARTGGPGQVNTYDEQLIKMFTEVLTTISNIIPLDMDLKSTYPNSNSRDQEFIQNLALFLCNFYGMHLPLIENLPNRDFLTHGHFYLIRISQIDDREIFKICLDYWLKLVQELYEEMQSLPISDMTSLT